MCAVRELTRLVASVVRESIQQFTSPAFPSLVRLLLDEGAQSLGNRVRLDDMLDNIFSVEGLFPGSSSPNSQKTAKKASAANHTVNHLPKPARCPPPPAARHPPAPKTIHGPSPRQYYPNESTRTRGRESFQTRNRKSSVRCH